MSLLLGVLRVQQTLSSFNLSSCMRSELRSTGSQAKNDEGQPSSPAELTQLMLWEQRQFLGWLLAV